MTLPNQRNCYLVHGFNVRDGGERSTDRLGEIARKNGYNPIEFDYGWIGLLGARFFSGNAARILASLSREGDIAIGHSNGCNIINQACDYGAKFKRIAYISPALERKTRLCKNVEKVFVLHTRKDWIVRLSNLLPFHPWGDMGCKGFCGDDPRYENIDCSNWSFGHSGYFRDENLSRLNYFLERYLYENENASFDPDPLD